MRWTRVSLLRNLKSDWRLRCPRLGTLAQARACIALKSEKDSELEASKFRKSIRISRSATRCCFGTARAIALMIG